MNKMNWENMKYQISGINFSRVVGNGYAFDANTEIDIVLNLIEDKIDDRLEQNKFSDQQYKIYKNSIR